MEAADHLYSALADVYPHYAQHSDIEQGVLSRYPLLEDSGWRNAHGLYQRVVVDIEGEQMVIYNVHPLPAFWWRYSIFDPSLHRAEIDDLLLRAAQEQNGVILAGDFNMSDQSEDYARIRDLYTDAFRAEGAGLGLTSPASLPTGRIDYVFINPVLMPIDARVWGDSGGSDHYPVWVYLAFTAG